MGSGNSIRANGRAMFNGVKCQWRDLASATTETVSVGTGAPWYTMREAAKSLAVARQRATARLSQIKRGVLTANLSVIGDLGLAAGAECVLRKGFKPDYVDSRWSIKTARHNYTNQSFVSSITAELPTK